MRKTKTQLTNSVARGRKPNLPGYTDPRGRRAEILTDVSRAELARRMGMDRSYLSRIFRGHNKPGREVLFRLANAMGLSVEDTDRWFESLMAKVKKGRMKKAS